MEYILWGVLDARLEKSEYNYRCTPALTQSASRKAFNGRAAMK